MLRGYEYDFLRLHHWKSVYSFDNFFDTDKNLLQILVSHSDACTRHMKSNMNIVFNNLFAILMFLHFNDGKNINKTNIIIKYWNIFE